MGDKNLQEPIKDQLRLTQAIQTIWMVTEGVLDLNSDKGDNIEVD